MRSTTLFLMAVLLVALFVTEGEAYPAPEANPEPHPGWMGALRTAGKVLDKVGTGMDVANTFGDIFGGLF